MSEENPYEALREALTEFWEACCDSNLARVVVASVEWLNRALQRLGIR